MTKRIFLWLNTLLAAAYFTGHFFDFFVIMPNWRAGSVELLTNYHTFFVHADPGVFFRIIVPASVVCSIVSFILYVKSNKQIKLLLLTHLIITLAAFAITMLYFLPINNYLFWGDVSALEPVKTLELAHNWVFVEHLRLIFGFVGLFLAGRALHLSYNVKGEK